MANSKLYHQDFYAWTLEQINALKKRAFNQVDMIHLIEEIEQMSARELREIRSRLIILIAHLLKWQYQSGKQSSSWTGTIVEQRDQLQSLLEQSPSLHDKAQQVLLDNKLYQKAVKIAAADTGINAKQFAAHVPYTLEQLLDDEFWPN